MEAEHLQGQMIMEGDRGWLRRDLEYDLHRGACRAAMTLYSEQVAFNRPQDTRSHERGSRFLPLQRRFQ